MLPTVKEVMSGKSEVGGEMDLLEIGADLADIDAYMTGRVRRDRRLGERDFARYMQARRMYKYLDGFRGLDR